MMHTGSRDIQLDAYRGLVMLYVPCVVHIIYWLDLGSEPLRSLILIEMPLIFFISGASVKVSNSRRGIWATVNNRLKRVVLPYYIYAAVSILFLSLLSFLHPSSWHIADYTWGDFCRILIADDIPQLPFVWHLWFILPYLIVSCSMPLQRRIIETLGEKIHLGVCSLLCLLSIHFCKGNYELMREVCCYNLFFVLGYLYYGRLTKNIIVLSLLACVSALLLLCLGLDNSFCPMQSHKFPPDLLFMTYGLVAILGCGLFFSFVRIPHNRVLDLWSKRGYTIYLYQNFVIYSVYLFMDLVPISADSLGVAVLCSVVTFVVLTLISFILYPFERFIVGRYEKYFCF